VVYLDSSALVKRYVKEAGTEELAAKLQVEESTSPAVFTSILTYAEIHATLARKFRDKSLRPKGFAHARREFDTDWAFGLTIINLETSILASVRTLVREFPLKGSDAIHLASALWLLHSTQLRSQARVGTGELVFVTSDKKLGRAAVRNRLKVFDPQSRS